MQDFRDVLIVPTRTAVESKDEVNLDLTVKRWKHATLEWSGIPIFASNHESLGVFPVAKTLSTMKVVTMIRKEEPIKDWHQAVLSMNANYLCPTIGIENNKQQVDNLRQIMGLHKDLKFIYIHADNGHQLKMINTINKVRQVFPTKIIIAGDVITEEGVAALLDAGADIVKVGLGSSESHLRTTTGIGYPQLTSLQNCVRTAYAAGGHILSDGGFQTTGDIVKAFGAGANFVFVEDMFLGHEECEGVAVERFYKSDEILGKDQLMIARKFKQFYSINQENNLDIPYAGPIMGTANNIIQNVKNACMMLNCRTIQELPRHVRFVENKHPSEKIDLTKIHNERIIYSVGVDEEVCNHQFPNQYKDDTE
jgi:GMP reductase